MELQIEQIAIYGLTAIIIIVVLVIYIWKQRRDSKIVDVKISQAKEDGLHEPVSLYPVIDPNRCIGSGACGCLPRKRHIRSQKWTIGHY